MMKNKVAQYKQIEMDISDKISSGYYSVGAILPTEQELVSQYGVSRVTVRKAMDNLVAKDMLVRTPGVGTFVKQAVTPVKNTSLCGFTAEITAMGMTPRTVVDQFHILHAPANIAHLLELPEDALIYHIRRKRYANDRLLMLETTYMSVDLYPEMSVQILSGSKYEYFENVRGKKPASNQHTVTPILPSASIAELFQIDMQTPIIKIANITRFADGQIMDYTENTLNSPHYQLRYFKH